MTLKNYHGLKGMQIFRSMQIFDRPKNARGVSYQEAWAEKIIAAFKQAQALGQTVTTDLFLGTGELVRGRKANAHEVTVENNLYSLREIVAREGIAFVTGRHSNISRFEWTSTEKPGDPSKMCNIDFADGKASYCDKDSFSLSARLLAFQIIPNPGLPELKF